MNLFEYDKAIDACCDIETGEIIDYGIMGKLQGERDEKIEGIALAIKEARAEAVALKAEKDSLAKREKAAKNKADSLAGYLDGYLCGKKFKTAKVAISYRKSEAVDIAEDAVLPPAFLIPQPDKVDKVGIKKALKAGEVIAGAKLVEHNNLMIK